MIHIQGTEKDLKDRSSLHVVVHLVQIILYITAGHFFKSSIMILFHFPDSH